MEAFRHSVELEPLAETNGSVAQPDPGSLAESTGHPALARAWLLWRERRFILRACLTGVLFSILLAFVIPPRYRSTARLMPPDTEQVPGMAVLSALSATSGGLGFLANDLLGVKSSGALFVAVLRSRTVEQRLVERFNLSKVYWVGDNEAACRTLEENTDITEERKSGVIIVSVTDRSPQRAAQLARAYVEELNRLVALLSTSSAHRERMFIEERLKAVNKDLDSAAQQLSQFASKNTAIDIPAQGRAMVEAAATLQGQLIAAQAELSGLEQIYTPNNVRVRSLRARVAELRQQLDKLGGTDQASDLSSSDKSPYPTIRQLPLLGVTYADLYRRVKIQEAVYETLTKRYELAKIQEAKETPSVQVLDAANVPERRSYPPRTLIVCLGLLLFLVGSITFVIASTAWERADSRDPRKEFLQEVADTVRGTSAWQRAASIGSRLKPSRLWDRFRRHKSASVADGPQS